LVLKRIDKGTVDELVGRLCHVLHRDFNVSVSTGGNSVSTTVDIGPTDSIQRLVLVGASNLGRLSGLLVAKGYEIVNLCIPGWKITPENVELMTAKIKETTLGNGTAFVFDVFGNSCSRATLFDGSTTLPVKGSGGGYHLPGEVGVCNDQIFGKLVDAVIPVLDVTKGCMRIVIPPQPRYLYSPCCNDRNHCTNVGSAAHAVSLLTSTIHLRAVLKKKLNAMLRGGHWIPDSTIMLVESEDKVATDRLADLKRVSNSDGVHFTHEGYRNWAFAITKIVGDLQNSISDSLFPKQDAASISIAGSSGQGRHFWRGFCSPTGSRKHNLGASWSKSIKNRPHNFTGPYNVPWRRGGK
jgi:hypothetical protein